MQDAEKDLAEILKNPPTGLTEFLFNHNSLGVKFAEALALEIQTDEYVRRIDISHNKIPQDALKNELVDAMKHNESIVNMDLEGNIGFTAGIKHQLALCLMKNMETYKANG